MRSVAAAAAVFLASVSLALELPGLRALFVAVGFVGYVFFVSRALRSAGADDLVFAPRRPRSVVASGSAVAAGLIAGTIGAFSLGREAASARPRPGPKKHRLRVDYPRSLQGSAPPHRH